MLLLKRGCVLLALMCTACSGGSSAVSTPVSPSTLAFNPPVGLGPVPTGGPVLYSFCRPPISGNDLCQNSTDPSGGSPPYHFQLGTGGGFPPIGMTLNLNGTLTGIPTSAGSSTFTVCAVDVGGSSKCGRVTMTIDPATPTPAPATTNVYANWTCNNQSQCISVLGHNTGSAGPFCSVTACQNWGKAFILGTCDARPLYPIYNAPTSGTCSNYPN